MLGVLCTAYALCVSNLNVSTIPSKKWISIDGWNKDRLNLDILNKFNYKSFRSNEEKEEKDYYNVKFTFWAHTNSTGNFIHSVALFEKRKRLRELKMNFNRDYYVVVISVREFIWVCGEIFFVFMPKGHILIWKFFFFVSCELCRMLLMLLFLLSHSVRSLSTSMRKSIYIIFVYRNGKKKWKTTNTNNKKKL